MYEATTTEATRKKDKERQLDFFILIESKLACNMPNISLYPVQGMESICVGYNKTNQTRPHNSARNEIETLREGVSIAAHTQFIRDLAVDREKKTPWLEKSRSYTVTQGE